VLERLDTEIKRRSNVAGIFPSPKSTLRLAGAILLEQDDERAVAERRYFSAESMQQLASPTLSPSTQELLAAIGRGGSGVGARAHRSVVCKQCKQRRAVRLPSTAAAASTPRSDSRTVCAICTT
jgi:hypothetical protein